MASKLPFLLLGAAGVAGVVAWLGFREGGWWAPAKEQAILGAPVRRGPLQISVVQRGNLEAKNSVAVKSEIEGRATILYLVPEGTHVEKGDLVAELDVSEINEKRLAQDVVVQTKQASLTKAQQTLEIQKSQNESDIAAAQQKLDFADADLKKYQEGDWPKKLQEAEEAIVLAQEEMSQAADRLEWSKKLAEEGFLTRTELESDTLAQERARITKEQSERDKKLLIDYDNPRQLATLDAAVTEARRELDRVKLQADARLVDYNSDVSSAQSTLQLETEKLNKYLDQLQKARLVAPQAGMVIHARQDDRMMGSNDPIQEGAQVYERQIICNIPESDGMVVEAKIHETVLKQVHSGQNCIVRVDALPGQEFTGEVDSVAALPDKSSWWANPDQRLFKTTINLTGGSTEMRPEMSCEVEIQVASIPDTLYAPLQAVYYHGGQTICFVRGESDPRPITVGMSSPQWVEVKSGLKEGEVVLLSPPVGFKPEPAPQPEDAREGAPNMAAQAPGAGAPGAGAQGGDRSGNGGPAGKQDAPGGQQEQQQRGGHRPDGKPPGAAPASQSGTGASGSSQ